ncbi:MAG: Crp/Fnr family transcriptional regulator [Chitinophagaceae bacterium]|nr:Crp/Fnr family transcriptional regulator [Chitinophagaceae bacterium]
MITTQYSIRNYVRARINPSFGPHDELPFRTEIKTFSKGEIITDYGQIERCAYFLIEGLIQISIRRRNGDERILNIFEANSFFSAYMSFLTGEPSDSCIIALEDVTVEVIQRNDIVATYKHSLLSNQIRAEVIETYYVYITKMQMVLLDYSRTERYQYLLKTRPGLINMVSVKKLAQLLGMDPKSLSRIRGKIGSFCVAMLMLTSCFR